MGNMSSVRRRRTRADEAALLYTKPSGLYSTCAWDTKYVCKLILRAELAPRHPGRDDRAHDAPEECPICMLHYPSLNQTKCCAARLCTECYLQIRPPRHNKEPCPFCKYKKLDALFKGPRDRKEIDRELEEEKRAADAIRRASFAASTSHLDCILNSSQQQHAQPSQSTRAVSETLITAAFSVSSTDPVPELLVFQHSPSECDDTNDSPNSTEFCALSEPLDSSSHVAVAEPSTTSHATLSSNASTASAVAQPATSAVSASMSATMSAASPSSSMDIDASANVHIGETATASCSNVAIANEQPPSSTEEPFTIPQFLGNTASEDNNNNNSNNNSNNNDNNDNNSTEEPPPEVPEDSPDPVKVHDAIRRSRILM